MVPSLHSSTAPCGISIIVLAVYHLGIFRLSFSCDSVVFRHHVALESSQSYII